MTATVPETAALEAICAAGVSTGRAMKDTPLTPGEARTCGPALAEGAERVKDSTEKEMPAA